MRTAEELNEALTEMLTKSMSAETEEESDKIRYDFWESVLQEGYDKGQEDFFYEIFVKKDIEEIRT